MNEKILPSNPLEAAQQILREGDTCIRTGAQHREVIAGTVQEIDALRAQVGMAQRDYAALSEWNQRVLACLKLLSFEAQISGGTPGPNKSLMDAIENAARVMSLGGFMKAHGDTAQAAEEYTRGVREGALLAAKEECRLMATAAMENDSDAESRRLGAEACMYAIQDLMDRETPSRKGLASAAKHNGFLLQDGDAPPQECS